MATMLVEPFAPWLRELSQALQEQGTTGAFIPPADLLVGEFGVRVQMDVPGLRSEDLEIELENDVLSVRGERPYPYDEEDTANTTVRIERRFGRFERSIRVPGGLDREAIEASLSDGVLRMRIPQPEKPRPKKIEIKAEEDGRSRERGGDGG